MKTRISGIAVVLLFCCFIPAAKKIKTHAPEKENINLIDRFRIIHEFYQYKDKDVNCVFLEPVKTGKKPAIFLMQGFGCGSVINLFKEHPYNVLSEYLASHGFIVMRSDKPGAAAGKVGGECFQLTFQEEVAGFKSAYKKLLSMPNVDTSNIFIFGHSMGGMEAPFVASEVHPKGVMVYGVTIKFWYEYLLEMLRFQNPRFGISYPQMEKEMTIYTKVLGQILLENKTITEVVGNDSTLRKMLVRDFQLENDSSMFGKHIRFQQSLQKAYAVTEWTKVTSKVLSIYGEYDIEAVDNFSHNEIVRIVNSYHPGNAKLLYLPQTNHSMLKLDSLQQSFGINSDINLLRKKRSNGLSKVFTEGMMAWLDRVLNQKK